jgi:hypothetical protein
LALSLVGYPVVSALPVILGVTPRLFSVPFRAVVLGLAILALPKLVGQFRSARIPTGYALIALILILEALRMTWDFAIAPLPLDLPWSDYFLLFIGATLVPALALLQPIDRLMLHRAVHLCEVLGSLAVLLTICAVIIEARNGIVRAVRLSTEVLNPISLGHLAVTVAITNVYGIVTDSSRSWRFAAKTSGRCVMIPIALVVLVATGSRGPLISLISVTLATVALISLRSPRYLLIALLPLAAIVSVGFLTSTLNLPSVDRVANLSLDQSGLERIQISRGALQQFADHPLTGSAVVEYSLRKYPHNIVLDAMMALGIVGAALLIWLLLLTALRWVRIFRNGRPEQLWLLMLFLQYLIDSMISGSLAFSPQFWVCMSVLWGTMYVAGRDRVPSLEPCIN